VVKIEVGALPIPVEHVPWQQIIEYRNDPETKGSFLLIRDWMSEVARGVLTLSQVEETLEYFTNRLRRSLEAHAINSRG
jgi:ATP/maltotriose-dependent transcriptional regulator MalT